MPSAVSRFAPQSLSNPFAHLNQPSLHQIPHLQHPNSNLQGHGIASPGTYGLSNQSSVAIFGPSAVNSGLPGAFGGGGLGGGGGTGLASQAAQLGFAHGAALQQQQQQQQQAHDVAGVSGQEPKGMGTRIREVWKSNLAQEIQILRNLVDKYPYISMDTEFPGVVARPMGDFQSKASYHYQTVRCNVDLLKIIQLGITLFTAEGELPPPQSVPGSMQHLVYSNNLISCPCTWTFNFQFSVEDDMNNEESIAVLKKSGADFDKHATMGIDPLEFGSLLITSGLALSESVHWISFHSGYDFAYLVKLMWCKQLPTDEEKYRELVQIFFPNLLDVKYLLRHSQKLAMRNSVGAQASSILNSLGMKSGLQDLAEELGCQRVGNQHQAGSDAWLTGSVFWQMRAKIFDGQIPEDMNGQMWGLTSVGAPASAAVQAAIIAAQGGAANY